MTTLDDELRAEIAAEGAISVEAFVRAALAHQAHGYYRKGMPIGRTGDFITAPEISQVFGELLGLWIVEMWDAMGRPDPVVLVELGPGRGVMLSDALRAIGHTRPAVLDTLVPVLIEVNPELREQQRHALAAAGLMQPPIWLESFADTPPGPMILVANEFFDALPVRQFVRVDDEWRERMVSLDAAGRQFVASVGAAEPLLLPESLVDCMEGDIVETCPAAEEIVATIAARVVREGGAALIIDYGFARPSFGDTLQAVRDHAYADPFADPGEADISHHVDFAALQRGAQAAGAACPPAVPQGLFLARLGIEARAQMLMRHSPARAAAIEGAVRRLVHPGRMGVLFKAMTITHPDLPLPPGFASIPRRR